MQPRRALPPVLNTHPERGPRIPAPRRGPPAPPRVPGRHGDRHEGGEQHRGLEQLAPHADRVEDGLAAPERAATEAAHQGLPAIADRARPEVEAGRGRGEGNRAGRRCRGFQSALSPVRSEAMNMTRTFDGPDIGPAAAHRTGPQHLGRARDRARRLRHCGAAHGGCGHPRYRHGDCRCAEGMRRLADADCDLHCGGIDEDEPLPEFLRRERFLDMTAGVVAWRGHPLLGGPVAPEDLARYPWLDFDWPAPASRDENRPSLAAILAQLRDTAPARIVTLLRLDGAGLFAMAGGPWFAWLSTELLNRLPGGLIRPLPVEIGRYRYRSGFVARRAAEDLPPFRALEQAVRDMALGRDSHQSG